MNEYELTAKKLTEEQRAAYDQLWEEPMKIWREKARSEGSHTLLCQLILAPRFRNDLCGTLAYAIGRMEPREIPAILKAITQSLEGSEPFAARLEGYDTPAQKEYPSPSSSPLARVSPEVYPKGFPA